MPEYKPRARSPVDLAGMFALVVARIRLVRCSYFAFAARIASAPKSSLFHFYSRAAGARVVRRSALLTKA